MLLIHGSLSMGGVETFFVRMAKQRALENKQTIIVLLSNEKRSDSGLLAEAKKYATVIFLPDLTYIPSFFARVLPFHLSLLLPLKSGLRDYFKDVKHVHVTCGICALFYFHLSRLLPADVKFTIGVYHSLEFCWGGKGKLPYFERINRNIFFNKIDKKNIIFFNEAMVPLYERFGGQSFRGVNLFPIGVVDDMHTRNPDRRSSEGALRLVSVGRLVPFKTYNLQMIEVVSNLCQRGMPVTYDIYGGGPLESEIREKIDKYGLQENIKLKGFLDYSKFSDVVATYDIFIGSGTAIVQAASLGVCAVIGIENTQKAETYGFLTDISGFSYNEDGLYEKKAILDVIERFNCFDSINRIKLSEQHIVKSHAFSMQKCLTNFEDSASGAVSDEVLKVYSSAWIRLSYSMSFLCTSLVLKLKGSSLSLHVRAS